MKQYYFNSREQTENCIAWIREWFNEKAAGLKAIVPMNDGRDCIVTAMLCMKALGRENVIGIVVADSKAGAKRYDELFSYLGIKKMVFKANWVKKLIIRLIRKVMKYKSSINNDFELNGLFAMFAAKYGKGVIVSSRTASDFFIGVDPIFGNMDGTDTICPLKNFTETEVKLMRKSLCIPSSWCDDSGIPYSSFVATLDRIIRDGNKEIDENDSTYKVIMSFHNRKRYNYSHAVANFDGYEWYPYKEIQPSQPSIGNVSEDYTVDEDHYGGWKGANETY